MLYFYTQFHKCIASVNPVLSVIDRGVRGHSKSLDRESKIGPGGMAERVGCKGWCRHWERRVWMKIKAVYLSKPSHIFVLRTDSRGGIRRDFRVIFRHFVHRRGSMQREIAADQFGFSRASGRG